MEIKENEHQLVSNIQKQLKCKVIKVVGRGGQGLVLLVALEASPNNRAVVKVATKEGAASKSMSVEIMAQRKLTKEDTMQCDFLPIHHIVRGSFKDDYLLMHYYPISIWDWIHLAELPLSILKLQMTMIARAVSYCHARGIAHCDIKPTNIMLGEDLVPVLIDFGMAHIDGHSTGHSGGTKQYLPPEMYKERYKDTNVNLRSADSWSLGITFYAMLFKSYPFKPATNWPELEELPVISFKKHTTCRVSRELVGSELEAAKSLILGLLSFSPSTRLTAGDASRHSWFE